MSDPILKPKIKWPRWAWRDSGWWLTVFGTVFAVIAYVQPSVSKHSFLIRIGIAFGSFVLSPVLLLTADYILKACFAAVHRLRAYDDLHNVAERQAEQLEKAQEMNLKLSQELTSGRRFEIEKSLFYQDELYILLRKKRGARLEVGDMVGVIDAQDGGIMGVFEVSEVLSAGYRAKASYVDPVWLGFVHQNAAAEMPAPPNTIALLMPKD